MVEQEIGSITLKLLQQIMIKIQLIHRQWMQIVIQIVIHLRNAVTPGSPNDNNINGGGPNAGQDEDDHDPAGPSFYDVALRNHNSNRAIQFRPSGEV